MRRRTPGILLLALLAILGVLPAPAPAHADPLSDVLSMIEHHQLGLPVQPNQARTDLPVGWGQQYVGSRGLEYRFSRKGSSDIVKLAFTIESASASFAIRGAVSSPGAMLLGAVPVGKLKTALSIAGVFAGPVSDVVAPNLVDDLVQNLVLRNLCLASTIPPGSLMPSMDWGFRLLSATKVLQFKNPPPGGISIWLEPCAAQPQASASVPVSMPGIEGVLPAQPMVAPSSGNPYGAFDEINLAGDQTQVRVRGWAIDPNTTGPIAVHTYIDGAIVGTTTANTSRPDVGAAYPGFGNGHGFDALYGIPVGTHEVCVYAINVGTGNSNTQLPYCKTIKKHDRISELGFVRTNHPAGTELSAWHGAPHYTALYASNITGYPTVSDPQWVRPIALDTNGDGVDELGVVRFNHSSGKTELSLWHGAPHYQTLLTTTLTGYPAISDPQNVTPIAMDVTGDGIDELVFVRFNHSSGRTELSIWHGAPHYTTLLKTTLSGYPAVADPINVTPLGIDVNGDGVDEFGVVRSNHYSGHSELSLWQGAPFYTTYLPSALTGYPTIGDPQNVTPLAMDLNGDRRDELVFARTNHPLGTEVVAWHGAPNYTTLYDSRITGYPSIGDPQNVTVLGMYLPS